ncbi:MAG: hypothetical protein IPM23_01100 [Candidatus Melainabacteria bacterium]|nr:hypothetical protein [Candidatus Melainabacteria bacterium]
MLQATRCQCSGFGLRAGSREGLGVDLEELIELARSFSKPRQELQQASPGASASLARSFSKPRQELQQASPGASSSSPGASASFARKGVSKPRQELQQA